MASLHDLLVRAARFDPSSHSADDVTRALVSGAMAFTAFQFAVTLVIPAPYGRYAEGAPTFAKCRRKEPRSEFDACSKPPNQYWYHKSHTNGYATSSI